MFKAMRGWDGARDCDAVFGGEEGGFCEREPIEARTIAPSRNKMNREKFSIIVGTFSRIAKVLPGP
jgi:hypothetical protein